MFPTGCIPKSAIPGGCLPPMLSKGQGGGPDYKRKPRYEDPICEPRDELLEMAKVCAIMLSNRIIR
jgi:hypothetical protein